MNGEETVLDEFQFESGDDRIEITIGCESKTFSICDQTCRFFFRFDGQCAIQTESQRTTLHVVCIAPSSFSISQQTGLQ